MPERSFVTQRSQSEIRRRCPGQVLADRDFLLPSTAETRDQTSQNGRESVPSPQRNRPQATLLSQPQQIFDVVIRLVLTIITSFNYIQHINTSTSFLRRQLCRRHIGYKPNFFLTHIRARLITERTIAQSLLSQKFRRRRDHVPVARSKQPAITFLFGGRHHLKRRHLPTIVSSPWSAAPAALNKPGHGGHAAANHAAVYFDLGGCVSKVVGCGNGGVRLPGSTILHPHSPK